MTVAAKGQRALDQIALNDQWDAGAAFGCGCGDAGWLDDFADAVEDGVAGFFGDGGGTGGALMTM